MSKPETQTTNLNAFATTDQPTFEIPENNNAITEWFSGDHDGIIRYAHYVQNPIFDTVSDEYDSRVDAMEDKIREWVEELKDNTKDAIGTEELKEWLDVQSQFHNYSFRNTLLIMMQYPEATMVAGASTWKDMGRYPVKGSKAIRIRIPLTTTGKKCPACGRTADYDSVNMEKNSSQSPAENHAECNYDTDPKGWSEGEVVYGFTDGYVFDVSQTDGEPLPDSPAVAHKTTGEGAEEMYSTLMEVADSHGITVEEHDELTRGRGVSTGTVW